MWEEEKRDARAHRRAARRCDATGTVGHELGKRQRAERQRQADRPGAAFVPLTPGYPWLTRTISRGSWWGCGDPRNAKKRRGIKNEDEKEKERGKAVSGDGAHYHGKLSTRSVNERARMFGPQNLVAERKSERVPWYNVYDRSWYTDLLPASPRSELLVPWISSQPPYLHLLFHREKN